MDKELNYEEMANICLKADGGYCQGCGFRSDFGRECKEGDLCVCCNDDLDKLERMLKIWEEKL